MEIIVNGLFDLNEDKNFVLIDSNKNEKGTLEVKDGEVYAKVGDTIKTFDDEDEVAKWVDECGFALTEVSLRWVEYNPNPMDNKKANDCSIRAYCAAQNIEWEEAYDIACKYGKLLGFMPNDNITCKKILEDEFGYEYCKLTKEQRQKGVTVNEFAINHTEGTYVLDVAKHLVTVINGEYYDSWDSGKKKIKGYYMYRNAD